MGVGVAVVVGVAGKGRVGEESLQPVIATARPTVTAPRADLMRESHSDLRAARRGRLRGAAQRIGVQRRVRWNAMLDARIANATLPTNDEASEFQNLILVPGG
jgi:hypothetical protein